MSTPKNPFVWTEIYTSDLQRAKKFYETILQVTLTAAAMPENMDASAGSEDYFEMLFFPGDMNAHGASGALVNSPMFKPGPGGTMVYFECEDCATELSRVEGAGGTVIAGKMSIGEYGFCAIFLDTEGNQVGLHSMK